MSATEMHICEGRRVMFALIATVAFGLASAGYATAVAVQQAQAMTAPQAVAPRSPDNR